jgi:hypothetical protein
VRFATVSGAFVFAALMAAALPALASGTTAPLPPPDPTAANLSPAQIRERAYDACLVTQAKVMATPRETLREPCRCYARRTIAAMTQDEITAFRQTGYFNDSARGKALEALDACNLRRPI